MKRTLLSLLSIATISALSFGQSVIMEIGTSGDISGTQVDYVSGGGEVVVDLIRRSVSFLGIKFQT